MEVWRYELYHSSGPWKKHKYIKKIGNVYYYSKKSKQFGKDAKKSLSLANKYSDKKNTRAESNYLARSYSGEKAAQSFKRLATRELKSIPREIINDGKAFLSRLFGKK